VASAKIPCGWCQTRSRRRSSRFVKRHLKALSPPTCRLEITDGHAGEPYLVSPRSPQAQAGLRALKKAFGREPVAMREAAPFRS